MRRWPGSRSSSGTCRAAGETPPGSPSPPPAPRSVTDSPRPLSRDELQQQNQLLENQLRHMRSQHSGGNGLPAMSLSLLAILLPMDLLL